MVVRRDWISSRKIGVLSRGVQQPAVIAKVPTTALNSSPQVLLVSDILSLSVVRKSQAPSSGNSTAAARLMLPLVPRSLHESRLRFHVRSIVRWSARSVTRDRCRKVGWQKTILWGLQLVEVASKSSFAQMFVRPKIRLKLN